jgi:hypothetical protein
MSQTLQALNSIIKYKNERERQKIDRSLAMMDMATRLRQQKIDNARQERMMQLRENQETRQAEKADLDATYLNKQINALDKANVQQESELEIQKLQAQIRNIEAEATKKENINIENAKDTLRASIDTNINNQKNELYESFKRSLPGVIDAVNQGTTDSEFSLAEINQVIKNLPKMGKTKQEKNLYEYIGNEYGQFLIPAIAGFQLQKKLSKGSGGENYDILTDALSRFYLDVMKNEKMQNLYQGVFGKDSDRKFFENDLNKLSNIIKREDVLQNYKNSSDIVKDAKNYIKLEGKDRDFYIDRYVGEVIRPYLRSFTQEDIDEINRRKREAGEEEIPAGEFE